MAARWPALDGLRGVAIVLVVVAHARIVPVATGGMVGVTLFFVLSGFLITHLLIAENEKHGSIDLKSFYARRALRLFPALVIYLVLISLLMSMMALAVPIWESAWPPALYVANYVQILGMDIFAHRHTWSLAVEEHFYLVWPLLVSLGVTKRVRLLAGVVLLLVAWRLGVGLVDRHWAYFGTDTNAYALGLGCLLAAWRGGRPAPAAPRVALYSVAGLVLLGVFPHTSAAQLYEMGVWLPVVAAALSVFAVWGTVDGDPHFLNLTWLRWLGVISYPLYLWHAPLLQFPQFGGSMSSRLLAITVAIAVASLSWTLIERPVLRSRLRQRFHPQVPLPSLGSMEPAPVPAVAPTHV